MKTISYAGFIKFLFVCLVAVIVTSFVSSILKAEPGGGPSTADRLSHIISSGEKMIHGLQDGQIEEFVNQATVFIEQGGVVIDTVRGKGDLEDEVAGHLRMAVSEAEKALDDSRDDQIEDAINHALSALSHAEESNSMADQLVPSIEMK